VGRKERTGKRKERASQSVIVTFGAAPPLARYADCVVGAIASWSPATHLRRGELCSPTMRTAKRRCPHSPLSKGGVSRRLTWVCPIRNSECGIKATAKRITTPNFIRQRRMKFAPPMEGNKGKPPRPQKAQSYD
jgi:hypothetical protein